jgi:enterochelin esterase-like enzyme
MQTPEEDALSRAEGQEPPAPTTGEAAAAPSLPPTDEVPSLAPGAPWDPAYPEDMQWLAAPAAPRAAAPLRKLMVRVFYPLQGRRIVLRTDQDWNRDVEPDEVSKDGTLSKFRFSLDRPYFYFKPVLVDGTRRTWSQGPNHLAIMNTLAGTSVYPHFHSSSNGTISELMHLPRSSLADAHPVRIYYPPGYFENTLKQYPVLYMQDGKNLFFPVEAFLGRDWKMDRTLHLLDDMNLIDKVLLVGVYSDKRETEYTHPGYEAYGRYMVTQLKPAVDAMLRTLPGPQNTAVMGSSLGGVAALYLAWQWPEVFGKAACMSSTFTYRDDLFERIASEPKRHVEIYLDSGWPRDNYEVTRSMRDLLARRGYEFGRDFLYFAFPGAAHGEKDWALRCHLPLQFFFGKTPEFGGPDQDVLAGLIAQTW